MKRRVPLFLEVQGDSITFPRSLTRGRRTSFSHLGPARAQALDSSWLGSFERSTSAVRSGEPKIIPSTLSVPASSGLTAETSTRQCRGCQLRAVRSWGSLRASTSVSGYRFGVQWSYSKPRTSSQRRESSRRYSRNFIQLNCLRVRGHPNLE